MNNGLAPQKTVQALTMRDRLFGTALTLPQGMEPNGDGEHDLAGDTFFGLHSGPDLLSDPPAGRELNHALLAYAKSLDAWKEARQFSDGNAPAALTTTQLLWEKLRTDDAIQQALQQQQEVEQAEQDAQSEQAIADALNDEQRAEMAQKAREHANQLANALKERAKELLDNRMNQGIIAGAVKAGKEAGKEMAMAMSGWGMEAGQRAKMDSGAIQTFANKMKSHKLKQIALLAGRLRGIGFSARNQQVVVGFTPNDVIRTQDPLKMLPGEVAKLSAGAPDPIRKLASVEWADGGLMGWDLTDDAQEAGAFVGAVDVSGSMRGVPEILAKAATLAIAQIAKADNRRYELFSFSSKQETIDASSNDDWQAHMEWAANTISGGTSFDIALTKAMSKIEQIEQETGQKSGKADLFFASDGEGGVSDAVAQRWAAFKDRTGSKLYYLQIGYGSYGQIEQIADKVFLVDELTPGGVESITRAMSVAIQ